MSLNERSLAAALGGAILATITALSPGWNKTSLPETQASANESNVGQKSFDQLSKPGAHLPPSAPPLER